MTLDRTTIASLARRHEREERRLVINRLEEHGWARGATAEALGIYPNRLARLIDKYELRELYQERAPGRGRPRKDSD